MILNRVLASIRYVFRRFESFFVKICRKSENYFDFNIFSIVFRNSDKKGKKGKGAAEEEEEVQIGQSAVVANFVEYEFFHK